MIFTKNILQVKKYFFYMLFTTVICSNTVAQFESKSKTKPLSAPIIPSTKLDIKAPKEVSKVEFKKPTSRNNLFPMPNEPKTASVDLIKKDNFQNPNDLILKQLNKPEAEPEPDFKGDSFLGNFRSDGKVVKIVCRDYGEIDGDKVRVYLNDQIVVAEIYLQGDYREVLINLTVGFNKIEFQALNQGSSGPNTAEFIMFNDRGTVISSNRWNLTTGSKAKIIVTKE